MKTECPHCHAKFSIADEHKGKKGKCPKCDQVFEVLELIDSSISTDSIEQPHVNHVNNEINQTPLNQKKGLSKGVKIFLGVLGVIIFLSIFRGGTSSESFTFSDFKAELGKMAFYTVSGGESIRKSDLFSHFGKPEKMQALGDDVFLYYRIKEGMVQVIGHLEFWEMEGDLEYVEAGYNSPQQPVNIVEWYEKQGFKNPYTLKHKIESISKEKWEVYKDGNIFEEIEVPVSFGWKDGHKSCTITLHNHDKDGSIPENQLPKDLSNLNSEAECYIVRDDADGRILNYFIVSWNPVDDPNSDYEKKRREGFRSDARKSAERYVAELKDNYASNLKRMEESRLETHDNAESFILHKHEEDAEEHWRQYDRQECERHTKKVKGPFLVVKSMNLY
jgi:predicted Zn finger-like uncharacterized protein